MTEKKEARENNEHLVPRPFTSNNNEKIDDATKTRRTFGIQNRKMKVGRTEATKHIWNANCYAVAPIACVPNMTSYEHMVHNAQKNKWTNF